MGFLSKLIKTGLVLGTVYTAYQASEKTKRENGGFKADEFIRNFKDQATENSKFVVDSVKSTISGQNSDYTVSDKGENGYAYQDAAPKAEEAPKADETDAK